MSELELANAEIERLREAWNAFAMAIGFPADRQRFRHEVIAWAKKLKAEHDKMKESKP